MVGTWIGSRILFEYFYGGMKDIVFLKMAFNSSLFLVHEGNMTQINEFYDLCKDKVGED